MRKLATIRTISHLTPIPEADRIETAHIDGWPVVVQKGEFKENDTVVYLEIDSWVPKTLAPFLCKGSKVRTYNGIEGERLRTVKLRGQLSQGLVLPTIIHVDGHGVIDVSNVPIGEDVSEILGIQKWEAPIHSSLQGQIRSNFPSFIPKTDQERIQNMLHVLDDPYKEWEVTLKLDGSSITVYAKDGFPGVCSRNLDLKLNAENRKNNTFVRTAFESGLIDILLTYESLTGRSLAIQGELVGPGIQNNRMRLNNFMIYIFDIYDINDQRYLTPIERDSMIEYLGFTFGGNFSHVPLLVPNKLYNSTRKFFNFYALSFNDLNIKSLDDLLSLTNRINLNTADGILFGFPLEDDTSGLTQPFEGVVFKALDGSTSFKAINNDYLLGEK